MDYYSDTWGDLKGEWYKVDDDTLDWRLGGERSQTSGGDKVSWQGDDEVMIGPAHCKRAG